MREFIWAVKFLTIVPIDTASKLATNRYNVIMSFFPLVGLLIGLLLAGVGFVLLQIGFRDNVSLVAGLLLLLLTLLTGALHVDGLADTADGVLGGATKERRLEIMRDSRIGAFGAIAVLFDYLLRYGALTGVMAQDQFMILTGTLLCLMPVVGRWCQVIGAALCPYARPEEGTGKAFIDSVSWPSLLFAGIAPVLFCAAALGWTGLGMLVSAVVASLLAVFIIRRRIGGMTGDTLGALNEIGEVVFLLAFFCFYSPGAKLPVVNFLLQFIKL